MLHWLKVCFVAETDETGSFWDIYRGFGRSILPSEAQPPPWLEKTLQPTVQFLSTNNITWFHPKSSLPIVDATEMEEGMGTKQDDSVSSETLERTRGARQPQFSARSELQLEIVNVMPIVR
jgi:hypothetical protein